MPSYLNPTELCLCVWFQGKDDKVSCCDYSELLLITFVVHCDSLLFDHLIVALEI